MGGLYLGQHAAAAEAADAFGDREIGRDIAQFLDQLGPRLRRIAVEQAINLSENDQLVRLQHLGNFRGEAVIVANPDFLGRDRVIFVDDRHDIRIQQPVDGIFGVQEALAILEVAQRHQHLRDFKTIFVGNLLVAIEQQRHAASGGGLLVPQTGGLRPFADHVQSQGNRTGRAQDDFCPGFAQLSDVREQIVHERPARSQPF